MSKHEKPSPEERAAMWQSIDVPARLYRDADEKRITRKAFMLYIFICTERAVGHDEADDPDTVAALMARHMGVSEKTTRRYVQELIDLGYDVTWGGTTRE